MNIRTIVKRIISLAVSVVVLCASTPEIVFAEESLWNQFVNKTDGITQNMKEKTEEATDAAQKSLNQAGKQATKIGNDMSTKVQTMTESAKNGIQNAYSSASKYICNAVSNIDKAQFKRGWDTAAQYATATISAQSGEKYVSQVQNAITQTQTNIQNVVKGNGTLASKAGFVAEEWHTGTFNIDAVASGSDYSADRPASNKKASADVIVSKKGKPAQEASLKYYKDGTASAKAQSKTIMSNYQEYLSKETKKGNPSPLSFAEYIDSNTKLKDAYEIMKSEYGSEYAGQAKIIPEGQLDDASDYLRRKIGKESAKDSSTRNALAKGYEETLDSIADKLTAKDGTSSVPLSKEEAETLVQLVEDGDFDIEEFGKKGIKASKMIKPKYVLKQAVGAGTQAAALEMALTIGPDLFEVIAEGIRNGQIDETKLKTIGVDGALAGANGFTEGSISAALLTACKAGKFGAQAMNVSPDVIGTLTVLTLDSIKQGYRLSKGEITAEQYGDIMAEEIFVAVVSQASGTALSVLLPCIPGTYLIGSMVGGMIAAEGYKVGKEVVMQVAAGNGFEAIIPAEVNDTLNIGRETLASLDTKKMGNDLKKAVVSTTNNGLIKIKSLKN